MSNIPETGRTPRVQIRLRRHPDPCPLAPRHPRRPSVYLQIRNGSEYAKEASGNHVQQVVQPAVRGEILDARGADRRQRDPPRGLRLAHRPAEDEGRRQRGPHQAGERPRHEAAGLMGKVRLCDSKTPQPCWNGSPYQPIPITDEATPRQALQIRERSEDFPASPPSPRPCAATRVPVRPTPPRSSAISRPSPTTRSSRPRTPIRLICARTRSVAPDLNASTTRRCAARPASPVRGGQPRPGHRQGQERPRQAGSNLVTSIDAGAAGRREYELDNAMRSPAPSSTTSPARTTRPTPVPSS